MKDKATPDLFDQARERRDTGIERVIDKADEVSPGWSDAAYTALCQYLKQQPHPFVIEQAREWAEEWGLEHPHDGRAWGAIAQRAHKAGLIQKHGYAPTHSSNLSPKVAWRRRETDKGDQP